MKIKMDSNKQTSHPKKVRNFATLKAKNQQKIKCPNAKDKDVPRISKNRLEAKRSKSAESNKKTRKSNRHMHDRGTLPV